MPVPKRKTSKSRRDMRSACKFIRPKALAACTNCKEAISPHQACLHCGYYKGHKVLVTKLERSLKRGQARAQQHAAAQQAEAQDNAEQAS